MARVDGRLKQRRADPVVPDPLKNDGKFTYSGGVMKGGGSKGSSSKPRENDAGKSPLGGDNFDVPQQEKDAVGNLLKRIERAKTLSKSFEETTLPRLRKVTWGTNEQMVEGQRTSRTNMVFATQATLLPHIYAKNPEIAVGPTEAVGSDEYEQVRLLAKTSQAVLNRVFVKDCKLKSRVKSAIRSTMTTGFAWFKLSYQHSFTSGDPVILRRANDAQDNLARLDYQIAKSKIETDTTSLNQQREEISLLVKSLLENGELKVYKGFVLDRIRSDDMFILDESVKEFDDYVYSKALAHRIWMTDEDFETRFRRKPHSKAAKYGSPSTGQVNDTSGSPVNPADLADKMVSFRAVYEIWNLQNGTVCCVAEGDPGYCEEPRVVKPVTERFYPFYCCAFNIVEGRWRPLSDVELLEKLQEEYSETRYLYAEARKEAVPTRVYRKGGNLTEEDLSKLTHRKPGDFIGIEGSPSVPLKEELIQFEGVVIDPQAYDVTLIRNDMDMMVGLSDASRSNLIEAKTATEAEIMRQALMTRVAERQDTVEDLVNEMATATLEMSYQVFTPQEIQQIVGDDAQWPENVNLEEIFRKVRVQVKAGSSGKPNLQKEREAWTALLPQIQETMKTVAALRLNGQFDMAQSAIELLKESFTRFDEKIDVERFVPRQMTDETGNPVQDPSVLMAQKMQQVQQQMEEMQKQVAELTAQNQQLEMDLKIAKQAEQARIVEAEAKKAVDVANAAGKAQVDASAAQAKEREETIRFQRERELKTIEQEEANASAERMNQQKLDHEFQVALLEVAKQIVIEQMAAETAKETAAMQHDSDERIAGEDRDAAGKEVKETKKAEKKAVGDQSAMMMQMMERLMGMVEKMATSGGPRSFKARMMPDGSMQGESSPLESAKPAEKTH